MDAPTSLARLLFFAPMARKTTKPSRAYSAKTPLPLVGGFCLRRRRRAGGGISLRSLPAAHPSPPRCRAFPPTHFRRRLSPPPKINFRRRSDNGGGFRFAARTGLAFGRRGRGRGGRPAAAEGGRQAAAGVVSAPIGAETAKFQRCPEAGKRRGVGLRFALEPCCAVGCGPTAQHPRRLRMPAR